MFSEKEEYSILKKRFRTAVLGGTFDIIHKGHQAIFSNAFESANNILIGVTTDDFVVRLGKNIDHNFKQRVEKLRDHLDQSFDEKDFQIVPLNDYFGIETYADNVEVIIASHETSSRIIDFNKKRVEKGFKTLQLEIVDTVLANDGKPISSDRIRIGEIDNEGNLLKND